MTTATFCGKLYEALFNQRQGELSMFFPREVLLAIVAVLVGAAIGTAFLVLGLGALWRLMNASLARKEIKRASCRLALQSTERIGHFAENISVRLLNNADVIVGVEIVPQLSRRCFLSLNGARLEPFWRQPTLYILDHPLRGSASDVITVAIGSDYVSTSDWKYRLWELGQINNHHASS